MKCILEVAGTAEEAQITKSSNGQTARIIIGNRTYDVDFQVIPGSAIHFSVEGKASVAFVAPSEQGMHVFIKGRTYYVQDMHRKGTPRAGRRPQKTPGKVSPPTPAVVVRILVKEGDTVAKGQGLVVVSAMKMETTLTAPYDGRVSCINTTLDAKVKPGDILVEIERQQAGDNHNE